jgi:hypothetical protein
MKAASPAAHHGELLWDEMQRTEEKKYGYSLRALRLRLAPRCGDIPHHSREWCHWTPQKNSYANLMPNI